MSSNVNNECFINGVRYRCRTCFDPGRSLYSLQDECSNSKTWRDLFREVAHLQTKEDELLPNTVCSKCLDKLITFYDFILQINNVNKKYMELLAITNDPLEIGNLNEKGAFSDCLSECGSDIQMEEFISEIKLEEELIAPYDIVLRNDNKDDHKTFDEDIEITSMQLEENKGYLDQTNQSYKTNYNDDSDNFSSSSYEENEVTQSNKVEMSSLYEQIIKIHNRFACPKCMKTFAAAATCRRHLDKTHSQQTSGSSSSSSDECDNIPTNSQTNEESVYDEIEMVDNRFACPICKKTFTLKRNCRRHIHYLHLKQGKFSCGFCEITFICRDYLYAHLKRMHPGETIDSNNKVIQRLFGDRLYSKPTAWRHVECKLCLTTFTTTKELRRHLENHSDLETLHNLELNDEIVQHLFPNIDDLNIVKESIVKDISEKNYFKYYKVLNEYCYEMSVSDTEAEDLLDETTERSGKYKCELCAEELSFKYQVFLHLKEAHPKEEIPLKCKRCKLEFVSIDMYEKHIQTHCRNKHKVLCCENCPGTFVWSESKKNHNCPSKIWETSEVNAKNQLKSNDDKVVEKTKNEEQLYQQNSHKNHSSALNVSENVSLVAVDDQIKSNMPKYTSTISKTLTVSTVDQLKTNYECQEHLKQNYNDSVASSETIIRCALCALSFKKLQHLHQHMPTHADGKTNIDFKDCLYVKIFKHLKIIDYPLWQQQIKNAFSKSQISRFYQAIDKYGNELDISDSDSFTDNSDADPNFKKQYTCDLCKKNFRRRKLLLNHQQERHTNVALPFTCTNCNQQFVNFHLLQQHLKRVCWNEHRRIAQQCEVCNARFIWPDNLLKHKEIQHTKVPKHSACNRTLTTTVSTESFLPNDELSITAELLLEPSFLYYCLMCPKTFFTIEHLNDHLRRHRLTPTDIKTVESIVHSTWWPNGEKIIKCKICDLTFETMAKLKQHFSPKNPQNFCANKHSLANYSITNKKGFELHLELDSETEIEDEQNVTDKNTLFPYKCWMCSKSFKRKFQVAQHQRSMHNYELLELKCERCIFRTVSPKILSYHKATQCFNVEKEYECNHCNFKFMWKENLDNHILSFHTPSELTTTTNTAKTVVSNEAVTNKESGTNISELINSEQIENNISKSNDCKQPTTSTVNKPLCYICGAAFNNNSNLAVHIRRHKGEKPFKCNFCEMAFPRNADLQEHRRTHTGERPYKCTLCEKAFSRQHKLTMHKRLHTGELPYHCTICPKSFNRSEHLKLHLLGHKGERPYKCNVCGKGFICASYLKRHRRDVGHKETDPVSNTNNGEEGTPKAPKKTLCPQCGVYLSARTSLTIHMRTHTGERPHKCEFCEMSYIRRCDLIDHRRVHTAERPFKCTYCEKSFTKRCRLKVHKRIHTGERPYKCTFCEKSFNKYENFRLHLRLHTGEKPYRCDVCSESFLCARYLKNHRIKKGHKEEKD